MAKHILFDVDEFNEMIKIEFTSGIKELEKAEWKVRDALDDLESLAF